MSQLDYDQDYPLFNGHKSFVPNVSSLLPFKIPITFFKKKCLITESMT